MITLEQAKALQTGTVIYQLQGIKSNTILASNGQMFVSGQQSLITLPKPVKWKINGKIKTWKTRPNDVKVPIKHGLYQYGYLDQDNLHLFSLESE